MSARPRFQPQAEARWTVGGVPVQVKRSARRRSVALQVQPGSVTLHVPTRTPDSLIAAFIEARRAWAERHLFRFAAREAPAAPTDGAALPFLGETLTLRLVPGLRSARRHGAELHVPPGDAAALKAHLERWYRRAALPELRALVEGSADALGARERLGQVRLSSARTRWGSCAASGDIRLHWALVRAPREVAAYVALHEAAHLLEFNHSPRYWAHLGRLMPGHARWRAWLKDHGHTLTWL